MIKIVEVECQTPFCKNKVKIISRHPYFGILCKKCQERRIWEEDVMKK